MKLRGLTVRVPGKVMLAGEYAVLDGGSCLACTVDLSLDLTVAPGTGHILSDLWPEPLHWPHIPETLRTREPLLQVLDSLARSESYSLESIDISVRSQLDPRFGLGSSTAVRLAALMGLHSFFHGEARSASENARAVWQWQRERQSFASGYDALVQSFGGLIQWTPDYGAWPGPFERLPHSSLADHVHVWVGGRGAPTDVVGIQVQRWLQERGYERELLRASNHLVAAFRAFLCDGAASGWRALCEAVRTQRSFFSEAPAYPRHLLSALAQLPGFDESWTFKTTGAGGEDAILLLGKRGELTEAFRTLSEEGWQALLTNLSGTAADLLERTN